MSICRVVAATSVVLLATMQGTVLGFATAESSDNSSAAMLAPTLSCYLEHGFDYVGYDINWASGALEHCCSNCAGTTGCVAWTWTNHNGGTCWLKAARGEVVVNPAATSAVVSIGQVLPVCEPLYDHDYEGNDIKSVAGTSTACCDACHNTAGCRAYSWSNHEGGTCWLKSKAGSAVYKQGVQSALAYPYFPEPGVCYLEYNTDYEDNDTGSRPSPTPEGCCEVCQTTVNCKAFSWTNQNGGTCWLKSGRGKPFHAPGVVSSVVGGLPPPGCALEHSVDYIGNDIANAPSGDAQGCCSLCKQVDGCRAFSWSNHEGGTCWFKSAKGQTLSAPGVVSSVL